MADNTLDIAQEFYPETVDEIRERDYPSLRDITYLDHAGTTLYAKSLIENYSKVLTENLFGNPHSASASSQLTSSRIEDIRLQALRFFKADPDVYDLVFVPNATAGIKLVADALRDFRTGNGHRGFWYGYHVDSHTSLVGARELADLGNLCFTTDEDVRQWINNDLNPKDDDAKLFAYPAQSNMNGRRFPLRWCDQIRALGGQNTFTLLDTASLVSTTQLDLSDSSVCPDFTVVSFYKLFGFPDLGALIVRKESGHIFQHRKFFGGGTVDMVTVGHQWHARKQTSIHDQLEDGTLPFHNIIALDSAFRVHERLYGSMSNISAHTSFLALQLFNRLSSIKHGNGMPVCHFYMSPGCSYEDPTSQGPILALNLLDSNGGWVGKSEIEKLASVKGIHTRSGTLCNPGGTASLLGLSQGEMEANYNAGQRCGDENDIMQGKPTGALRLSLGSMTSSRDIDHFVAFITEFYAEQAPLPPSSDLSIISPTEPNRFYVESLCVYPIKSCSGFTVPSDMAWQVHPEGLAWDREWCIVHQGTGAALSQKRYPRMALIKPVLDLENGFLRITGEFTTGRRQLNISLCRNDTNLVTTEMGGCQSSSSVRKSSLVCGDRVVIQVYSSAEVSSFFSDLLGVPCTLARFPPQSHSRHAKTASSYHSIRRNQMPGSFPLEAANNPRTTSGKANPILLSNESPILLISRSSVNRLNEQIKANSIAATGWTNFNNNNNNYYSKTVAANVFRANIVVAENLPRSSASLTSLTSTPNPTHTPVSFPTSSSFEQPYIEDTWSSITIGPRNLHFDILGSCQRCQMVCVDQLTAERREEPLSTLAKTRRVSGKVLFGRHLGLSALGDDVSDEYAGNDREGRFITVGDIVVPSHDER